MIVAKDPVKILLVEDNVDQRELTLRAFRKKDPGLQVTAVENGPACLEMLRQGHFDAIILDYSLPMMNGIEVLSQIQAKGCPLPVIMVTGQGDEKIAVEAMKRGAYDYIIKSQNDHQALPSVTLKVIDDTGRFGVHQFTHGEAAEVKAVVDDDEARERADRDQ